MSDTITVFRLTLPVIARSSEGICLVAHPDGPAFAHNNGFGWIGALETESDELPAHVRAWGVRVYREATWEAVKGTWLEATP